MAHRTEVGPSLDGTGGAGSDHRFLWAIALATLLRIPIAASLPLTSDEAYYWEWSRHPSFGYYDHAPLIAWAILAGRSIGGHALISVRATSILFLAVAAWGTAALGRTLFHDRRAGRASGLPMLVTPLFFGLGLFATPDAPLAAFSVLAVLGAARAFFAGKAGGWILAGAASALAIASKEIGFVVPASIGLFLLLSRSHRAWLRRKEPYIALAVFGLLLLPVIHWQASHEWVTYRYQILERDHSFREGVEMGPSARWFAFFLATQPIALSPIFFAAAVWALINLIRRARRDPRARFTLLATMGTLAPFTFAALWNRVSLHWPLAAWPPLFAWLGGRLSGTDPAPRWVRRVGVRLGLSLSAGGVLLVAIAAPVALQFPCLFGFPSKPEEIRGPRRLIGEAYGWEQLGRRIASLQEEGDPDTFIATYGHTFSPLVAFHVPGEPDVFILPKDRRARYRSFLYWQDTASLAGRDAIVVAKEPVRGKLKRRLEAAFEGHEAEPMEIFVRNRYVRTFYLIRCRGFRAPEPPLP